jgi:uncharacterized protein (DUF488 family)
MNLYTIGFTRKRAQDFFDLLKQHEVARLIDIRLHPGGQLAGFAKGDDLPYFLRTCANGCAYVPLPILAPASDILDDYRADKDWSRYVARFEELLDARNIPDVLDRDLFTSARCCLLCSEATPEQCHRRLVAERLAARWPNINIVHL